MVSHGDATPLHFSPSHFNKIPSSCAQKGQFFWRASLSLSTPVVSSRLSCVCRTEQKLKKCLCSLLTGFWERLPPKPRNPEYHQMPPSSWLPGERHCLVSRDSHWGCENKRRKRPQGKVDGGRRVSLWLLEQEEFTVGLSVDSVMNLWREMGTVGTQDPQLEDGVVALYMAPGCF